MNFVSAKGYDEEVRDIKIDNLVKVFPEYLKPNWI